MAGHHLGSRSFLGRGTYLGYKGEPGCGILSAEKSLLGIGLYICPQGRYPGISGCMGNMGLGCEGQGQFTCANWGCETISTIDNYKKQNDDHIRLIRGPSPATCSLGSCNPIIITIKTGSPGRQHYWLTGQTWGIGLYKTRYDSGLYFTIQVKDPPRKANPIGPNKPLLVPGLPQSLTPKKTSVSREIPTPALAPPGSSLTAIKPQGFDQPQPEPEGALITMLTTIHKVLNKTTPDIGQDCWLCLNLKSPYYVEVGTPLNLTELSSARGCEWETPRLTLGDIQEKGTCLISKNYSKLLAQSPYFDNCNHTIEVPASGGKYYKAPNNTWLACDSGLTHCAASNIFNSGETNICILVFVLPQVSLYNGLEGRLHFFHQDRLQKRAVPVLIPLLVGLGIAGSAAVGTTALIKGENELHEIGIQIDKDIKTLKDTINEEIEIQRDGVIQPVDAQTKI
ncbi:endogenous retrovirus group S71 member 1 Env polyprotein-like [Pteropus vampyrus]|uniref:Endogenous retrovirus group S71 member 1 Env polyprotein-like n=1 Tax=Pteropus vampyrus TaxID=132908 RepID=A0A6P6BSK0_PTEVA|nr:endogenous retrovirus group S71 member 1 Env polyprotein-like [Pteropus vampyrus]